MAETRIYTDGSYRLRVDGGWAFVVYMSHPTWTKIFEDSGSLPSKYANQAAELTAMGKALVWCQQNWQIIKRYEDDTVEIVTDSEYTFNGLTKYLDGWVSRDWRKSDGNAIAHKKIWQRLHALSSEMPTIKFRHMRGHQKQRADGFSLDIEGNNRADWLAGEARKKVEVLA